MSRPPLPVHARVGFVGQEPRLFNGTLRATVADPAFGPPFFGIWLAPWTSEPRLRGELLARLAP